jgi:hypothetical protein
MKATRGYLGSACWLGGALLLGGCGDAPTNIETSSEALLTDDTPPPLEGELTLARDGCGRVVLSWPNVKWPETPESDESGLKFYRVYQNGVVVDETQGFPLQEFARLRSTVRSGLTAGAKYAFGVSAVDRAGNESPRLEASISTHPSTSIFCRDVRAPLKPHLAIESEESGDRACRRHVSLDMSAKDPAPWWDQFSASGIAYYNVFRNGHLMGRSDGGYSQYLGQYPGTTYWYTVTAVDNAGNESVPSNGVAQQIPADCALGRKFPETIRLLVLPVRPSDGPPDPFPASLVYDFVGGGPSLPSYSVREYMNEISYGRLAVEMVQASKGWITLPEKTLRTGEDGYCSTPTDTGNWGFGCDHEEMLEHALAATGFDPDDYDFVLFVKNGMTDQHATPSYATVHVGIGATDVSNAYTKSLHELSHRFGGSMEHSGGKWFCPGRSAGSGFANLTGVDIFDPHFGCNAIDAYGDRYSALGRAINGYHLPMLDKWLKGFLSPSQTVVAALDTSEVELHSAESLSAGEVVRHVVVPYSRCSDSLGSDTPFFSLEYRTATSFDADPLGFSSSENPPLNGLQIRLAPWNGVYVGASESIFLGTLELGATTRFEYQGIVIELLEAKGDTARVRIARPHCWIVHPG